MLAAPRGADAIGVLVGQSPWSDPAALLELITRVRPAALQLHSARPAKVADAIGRVRPYGVDVTSGVKGVDGCKHGTLLELDIRRAQG